MFFKSKLNYLFFSGVSLFTLLSAPLAAGSDNTVNKTKSMNNNSNGNSNFLNKTWNSKSNPLDTSDVNIFEQEDEKRIYTDYGFSRGDISYLYTAQFNPQNIQTLSGEVVDTIRVQYPDLDCYLIALVRSNNEQMAVNLGPVWFIDENNMTVDEGDDIQITGSRIRNNGRYVFIVSELTKNGDTLKIRDQSGTSLWGAPRVQSGDADCMKYSPTSRSSTGSGSRMNNMNY